MEKPLSAYISWTPRLIELYFEYDVDKVIAQHFIIWRKLSGYLIKKLLTILVFFKSLICLLLCKID